MHLDFVEISKGKGLKSRRSISLYRFLLSSSAQCLKIAKKSLIFKKSSKWSIFGTFNELLSTQNVNVARFARNVECDFFSDFQTLFGPTTPKGLLCMHNESVLSTKKF